jgi:FAD/FMN-containing dehydrogenase
MPEIDIPKLSQAIAGEVVKPGDQGYDEARSVWNARFDRRPELIARCREASDVQTAVRFARQQGLEVSVKGGGHAYAANTVGEGGLLIDLSRMRTIAIDLGTKTARVGPGVTWGELQSATEPQGLAPVGGTVSTVGVAGFTLGGGSGYLSRKYGMGVDNLLSAEVVTAHGERVAASETENPDLFWALRGGGGNFGVVTGFELQLHEVGPEILTGQIVHRFEEASKVLRLYRDFMDRAPDEVQCYAFILRIPPIPEFPKESHGQLAVDLVVFHPDPTAEKVFRPLLDFGDPILAFTQPQALSELLRAFDAGLPAGQRYESGAHDFRVLSDEAIDAFLSQIGSLPGEFTMAYLGAGGGAIGRIDPAATAFPHRDAPYGYHLMAGWTRSAQDSEVTQWISRFQQAMTPYATGGVYVNLLGTNEQDRVPAAYGVNYERLVELKKKWDPDNLFRMNHNIQPSG